MVESAVGVLTILLLIILIVAVVYVFILALELEHLFESVRNAFVTVATWRPKSGIDKEIAEEEKEIAELERQKEKMETLEELKRRKEKLFSDVHGTESWECKWCGEDDCLKPAYTVDGIAQYYCTSCHRWLNDGSSKA